MGHLAILKATHSVLTEAIVQRAVPQAFGESLLEEVKHLGRAHQLLIGSLRHADRTAPGSEAAMLLIGTVVRDLTRGHAGEESPRMRLDALLRSGFGQADLVARIVTPTRATFLPSGVSPLQAARPLLARRTIPARPRRLDVLPSRPRDRGRHPRRQRTTTVSTTRPPLNPSPPASDGWPRQSPRSGRAGRSPSTMTHRGARLPDGCGEVVGAAGAATAWSGQSRPAGDPGSAVASGHHRSWLPRWGPTPVRVSEVDARLWAVE